MDINEITDNLCACIMPQAEDADEFLLMLKVQLKQGCFPYSAPHLDKALDEARQMFSTYGADRDTINRVLDLAYSSLMDC